LLQFLHIVWDADPVIFSIGSFHFRWYALAFTLAIPIAYGFFRYFLLREGLATSKAIRLVEYGLIGVIVGARLGQVFFYEWEYFSQNPLEILKVWNGGLASHGAAIGVLLASYLFARKHVELSLLWILDRGTIIICFGAGLIRIGNLFNSEIYGMVTSVPWAFQFSAVDELFRHPSQIYDALLVFILGAALLLIYKQKRDLPKGLLLGLFFSLGFGIRMFLEQWKAGADTTQLLNVPIILTGAVILYFAVNKRWGTYKLL